MQVSDGIHNFLCHVGAQELKEEVHVSLETLSRGMCWVFTYCMYIEHI